MKNKYIELIQNNLEVQKCGKSRNVFKESWPKSLSKSIREVGLFGDSFKYPIGINIMFKVNK